MPLTPEQARRELAKFEIPGWEKLRRSQLNGVARGPRRAAEELIRPRFTARPQHELAEAIERLSSRERESIFGQLHPQLGRHLERMWQLGKGDPYQTGWTRMPFRASEHSVTLPARWDRLVAVSETLRGYEGDARWVARWGPYLDGFQNALGWLLAAVIEGGGEEGDAVYDILIASANGDEEVGTFGRHVTTALLTASRPDGWAFVERMLLAGQRQEGLRQAILETVDQAHPTAFRRMLDLIVSEGLARFSATLRAVDVWFGWNWTGVTEKGRSTAGVDDALRQAARFLDDPAHRLSMLDQGNPSEISLALWAGAVHDAPSTVSQAERLLASAEVERRYVAVDHLGRLNLSTALGPAATALADADLRVAARALDAFWGLYSPQDSPELAFEQVEQLFERLPAREVELGSLVWPWTERRLGRDQVGYALVHYAGKSRVKKLLPHVRSLAPESRATIAKWLREKGSFDSEERGALLSLAADASTSVRTTVAPAIAKLTLSDGEAKEFEIHLRRRPGDLRRMAIAALVRRSDAAALASSDRLLASSDELQRLGGLEILRQLAEAGRSMTDISPRASRYRDTHGRSTPAEEAQLNVVLGLVGDIGPTEIKAASLDAALGLLKGHTRSMPTIPHLLPVRFATSASDAAIKSLDERVHELRDVVVRFEAWEGYEQKQPLGEITWGFPDRLKRGTEGLKVQPPDMSRLPLADSWLQWASERSSEARDADGLELLRAKASLARYDRINLFDDRVRRRQPPLIRELRYSHTVESVLDWLVAVDLNRAMAEYVLDALEVSAAAYHPDAAGAPDDDRWRAATGIARGETPNPEIYVDLVASQLRGRDAWSNADEHRLWGLLRFLDEPWFGRRTMKSADSATGKLQKAVGGRLKRAIARRLGNEELFVSYVSDPLTGKLEAIDLVEDDPHSSERYPDLSTAQRRRPSHFHVRAAFEAGATTDGDLIDALIGERTAKRDPFEHLAELSRKSVRDAASQSALAQVVDVVRDRVVAVELGRGEAPTPATRPALALRYSGDEDAFLSILVALGKEKFVRGWGWAVDGESRTAVLSRLLRVTWPSRTEALDSFAERIRSAGIGERRMVEAGTYAPQWALHAEAATGWDGLADGIWWMHAHTKDDHWSVDEAIREAWAAEIAERTRVPVDDLVNGAVDTDWFWRVQARLGDEQWDVLDGATKYASTAGGHTRARLFASALRGKLDENDLLQQIEAKRNKDAVRSLGLLPLPPTDPAREAAILSRYTVLENFRRQSRNFGAARRESESRAVDIATENLARAAGFADPIRLTWAMEARGVADLADAPLVVERDDLRLALAIDHHGAPNLTVTRAGASLKSIPDSLKRDPEVAALRARVPDLRRRASRIRVALELAMSRGDALIGEELHSHSAHPLLWPQLRRLALVSKSGDLSGYPVADGRALLGPGGSEQAVGPGDILRVVHPVDLLELGNWSDWQRDVFKRERVQPFKQVFREVYVPTPSELDAGTDGSNRYAGNQVQPRKMLAILGTRGWVNRPDEGLRRTFHRERITVALEFEDPFFTPADVENAVIDNVRFYQAGSWKSLAIADVPRRLFSEAMRDVDLIVSVAHAGGVDPETSSSTVEMRAAIVRETATLLSIDNIALDGPRVVVNGEMAEYSVHLGSGIVHMRPGGALVIVAVHGQHRGRLFLPFADDDPKTAEVVSKVLLLARDREIRDPAILEQIRRAN